VVVQTEGALDEIKSVVPPHRIVILPNPVEFPAGIKKLTGEPKALFMGRLSQEKGVPTLLDAWALVARCRGGAQLTILGEGGHYRSEEDVIRETVRNNPVLRQSVNFAGWVSDPLPHLSAADVFVFPSFSEGMSNALLEGCASRRIVVASNIPPNLAVLGSDYVFLFEAGDPRSLFDALLKAFDDPELRDIALKQIDARMTNFSASRVMERLEDVLRRSIAPKQ
jgi:glycosyltransferase involved in cell wall biosynthesis